MRRELYEDVHHDFAESFRTFLSREVVGDEGRYGQWERDGIVPRELLRGLERRLVEVVDDVLRDVLLRARALVEARADVLREALMLGRAVGRRRLWSLGGCSLHGASVRRGGPSLLPANMLRAA